jgi:hypothetical protein
MKKLLTPFLLMLSVTFLLAQDAETPPSFQRDIGFNTTFIIQGVLQSNQTPFSLMYKEYTAENKAIRLGMDVYFNINKTDSKTSTSSFSDASSGYMALVIGKEFQRQIEKKWTWYFGGDVVPFFNFNNQDVFSNGELYLESDYQSYGVGVRPFLGIRFNINPRLYLSAEANVALNYGRTKNYLAYTNNPVPATDTKGSSFSFAVSPASGLFLYYRF